jgi:hypothetical protein
MNCWCYNKNGLWLWTILAYFFSHYFFPQGHHCIATILLLKMECFSLSVDHFVLIICLIKFGLVRWEDQLPALIMNAHCLTVYVGYYYVFRVHMYWGLAVTSRDDVIDGRPPYCTPWWVLSTLQYLILLKIHLKLLNFQNQKKIPKKLKLRGYPPWVIWGGLIPPPPPDLWIA